MTSDTHVDKFLQNVSRVALSVVNVFGSIGLTNFGYLDKAKSGVIREIDEKSRNPEQVNTFFDDLICAIAAAAASKIAHQFTW